MAFNQSQKKAIQVKKGPTLVLAGPGSGKTTVITEHTKFLLEENLTNDENILVVTFTTNAASEMKERFNKIVENKYPKVSFGTFHSIYFQIVKEVYNINEGNLIKPIDISILLKDIVRKLDIEMKDEKDFMSKLTNEISMVKCELKDIDTYTSNNFDADDFRNIYKRYTNALKEMNNIDFDDMLILCYKALSENPELLKKYQDKYKYILVDEFQDTNFIQFEVVKMLALPENNLFVVGDDDQSIYKFRGAKPEIMLNFKSYYPKCREINLDVNYRSTPQIVDGAQIVIKNNKVRYDKKLEAKNKTGEPIYLRTKTTSYAQCEDIIETIKENISLGIKPNNIAIIYRSNIQTRVLTECLMKHEIEFYIRDSVANIYEHWVSKDVFAYVQLAMEKPEYIYLPKIINKPVRYVGKDCIKSVKSLTIDNIIEYYNNSPKDVEWLLNDHIYVLKAHLDKLRTLTKPIDILNYIYDDMGYVDYINDEKSKNKNNEMYEDALFVLEDLKNAAKEFETCNDWFTYIYNYTTELNSVKNNKNKNENAINLLTMHSSKGLEYDVVFIIEANETITPSIKAVTIDDIEEERRMFYVAMTRAKQRLYIYSIRERNGKEIEKSRFVKELQKGLKQKEIRDEHDKIIAEMKKTQKTIDELSLQEKEVVVKSIIDDKPKKLEVTPKIEGVNTSKEIFHKTFEHGFLQKEENGKYYVFFVKKNKIIVLDKAFCKKYDMIYEF